MHLGKQKGYCRFRFSVFLWFLIVYVLSVSLDEYMPQEHVKIQVRLFRVTF